MFYMFSPSLKLPGNYIIVDGAVVQVRQAVINATSDGDTTVVDAVTGRVIRVVAVLFTCGGATVVSWKSGATTVVPGMSFAQYGGMTEVWAPHGYFFETGAGEAVVINLSVAASVRGVLNYVVV